MSIAKNARTLQAGAALAVVLGGCGVLDPAPDVPTPVPTVVADPQAAVCDLDRTSLEEVLGRSIDRVEDDREGQGAERRGSCFLYSDSSSFERPQVIVGVDDVADEWCTKMRPVVDGEENFGNGPIEQFTTLDGGAWGGGVLPHGLSSSGTSVAFVGDVCVKVSLQTVVAGREPVQELEAFTMQLIDSMGLDET